MRNYYGLGLCYLPQPSASAYNTNLCLNNSSYPTRPHSIIVYYFMSRDALIQRQEHKIKNV